MTTPSATGSLIVAALEAAWAAIQKTTPDLPDVVFITGTGLMGRGAKWGHYRPHGWATRAETGDHDHADDDALVRFHADGRRPEVFIAGERLASGADLTLQTLLHEAAHALNAARGEKGTSKEGRYHNRTFVAAAEELGLAWPENAQADATIGFSAVVLTDAARERFAEVIANLDAAIHVFLDTFAGMRLDKGAQGGDGLAKGALPGGAPAKPKSRNNPRALCACETPRLIRASRKVLEEAPIVCGLCNEPFTIEED